MGKALGCYGFDPFLLYSFGGLWYGSFLLVNCIRFCISPDWAWLDLWDSSTGKSEACEIATPTGFLVAPAHQSKWRRNQMNPSNKSAKLPTAFFYQSAFYFWTRQGGKRIRQYILAGTDAQRQLAKAGGKVVVTQEVLTELARIFAATQVATTGAATTVGTLVAVYLKFQRENPLPPLSKQHLAHITKRLNSFVSLYGSLAVGDLKQFHITQWLLSNPSWKGNKTRNDSIVCVKSMLNWASEQELISSTPNYGNLYKKPVQREKHLITKEEYELICASLPKRYAQFFKFLYHTGARPAEACALESSQCKPVDGGFIFTQLEHKNARKTGKPRKIYCQGEVAQIVSELLVKHPVGKLFQTRSGKGIKYYAKILLKLHRDKKIPVGLTLYSCRHTYITTALSGGMPIALCAELVGNSAAVIDKHYNQLSQKGSMLMAAASSVVHR